MNFVVESESVIHILMLLITLIYLRGFVLRKNLCIFSIGQCEGGVFLEHARNIQYQYLKRIIQIQGMCHKILRERDV